MSRNTNCVFCVKSILVIWLLLQVKCVIAVKSSIPVISAMLKVFTSKLVTPFILAVVTYPSFAIPLPILVTSPKGTTVPLALCVSR